LHSINDTENQLYASDYRPDGALFATAGKDYHVRLFVSLNAVIVSQIVRLIVVNGGWVGGSSLSHARSFACTMKLPRPKLLF
jgi:hypothetical protein